MALPGSAAGRFNVHYDAPGAINVKPTTVGMRDLTSFGAAGSAGDDQVMGQRGARS